jgi:glycosyltransferase involved in cell wall biosynthesis
VKTRALSILETSVFFALQPRLVGWVEHVEPLLRTLDLFVSAAHQEPFDLAIIEAMASGVPVIATMSEGAREIVEAGKTGKLVPVGDVEAIAKAISGLLADKSECDRLRLGAQRAVAERFGLERMVEATEDVYRQAR